MYKNLHIINQDPFFRKKVMTKFLNRLFFNGKKHLGELIFARFFLSLKKSNLLIDTCSFFINNLQGVRPALDVKTVQAGGSSYHIAFPVRPGYQQNSVLMNLFKVSRNRASIRRLENQILEEFLLLVSRNSILYDKATELLERAEVDSPQQHFRWY